MGRRYVAQYVLALIVADSRELKRRGRRELDRSRMDGMTISKILKTDGTTPSTHCKDETRGCLCAAIVFRFCENSEFLYTGMD